MCYIVHGLQRAEHDFSDLTTKHIHITGYSIGVRINECGYTQ